MTWNPVEHILVIDDIRVFGFPCTYARTVDAAIDLLFDDPREWEEVWLDYDMGFTIESEDARPLMRLLDAIHEEGGALAVRQFVIHTANPEGRRRWRETLTKHGYQFLEVDANDYLAAGQPKMFYVGKS